MPENDDFYSNDPKIVKLLISYITLDTFVWLRWEK